MLEIRHLKTLHALRETDSLVEAAERLHLTQSALSHQFKELEERLGLVRAQDPPGALHQRRVALLQLADLMLPQLRSAERDLARLAGGTAGRLHGHRMSQLFPVADADHRPVPRRLARSGAGPGVRIFLRAAASLARGDLDLVVTSDPLELPGITYVPLFTYEALLAVANQHPLAARRTYGQRIWPARR